MTDLLDVAADADPAVRAAWAECAGAALPDGWTRRLTGNGFIAHDLRFHRGEDWMFSAVLNPQWVLWYARRPSLRAGINARAMQAAFPQARRKDGGEVKLRLHDAAEAQAALQWCLQRL